MDVGAETDKFVIDSDVLILQALIDEKTAVIESFEKTVATITEKMIEVDTANVNIIRHLYSLFRVTCGMIWISLQIQSY